MRSRRQICKKNENFWLYCGGAVHCSLSQPRVQCMHVLQMAVVKVGLS